MAQLDHERERIQQDLRGLIAGDVRCDEIYQQLALPRSGDAVRDVGRAVVYWAAVRLDVRAKRRRSSSTSFSETSPGSSIAASPVWKRAPPEYASIMAGWI